MYIGAHVSILGGVFLAPQRAKKLGCECFQIFSRPPQGGKAPKWDENLIQKFKDECENYGFKNYYIHTPYIINLASANNRIRYCSINIIKEDLKRAGLIGAKAVVTHLGSANDYDEKTALLKTSEAIIKILESYKGQVPLLMEFSAGSGNIIGASILQMKKIFKQVPKKYHKHLKICFDTAHAFSSGIDLRTKKDIGLFLKKFDKEIGLGALKYIHANDSKAGIGEKKDRHEHLGKGMIGKKCFEILTAHPSLKKIDMVVETTTEAGMKRDIAFLKRLQKK